MDVLKEAQLIKQGAEAKIYLGKNENDQLVILKERFTKTYRQAELDKSLTKKRTKHEEKLLKKALSLGVNVPKVHRIDVEHGYLIMEYIENAVLTRDYISNLPKETSDAALVSTKLDDLSDDIGRCIGILHRNEIIHGDLTTSNILIKRPSSSAAETATMLSIEKSQLNVYFIDFGLSSTSHQLEDKAVDLYVLERALISTHSNHAKQIFDRILQSYCKEYGRHSEKVAERLEQVRQRGRKRTMVG